MKEKILTCKCHKVNSLGELFSKIEQSSTKGIYGIQTKIGKKWKKLNPVKTKKGYLQCNIHGRIIRMNRLIAFNFIPNPEAFPEVQHKNGISVDNKIENLKWGNQKENANDRGKHGHTAHGSKHSNAKLNEKKVISILQLRTQGRTLMSLAKKFNVSKKLILLICQKKIWKHVK